MYHHLMFSRFYTFKVCYYVSVVPSCRKKSNERYGKGKEGYIKGQER